MKLAPRRCRHWLSLIALLAATPAAFAQVRPTLAFGASGEAGDAAKKAEPATSAPTPAAPSFGGPWCERSKLTGDWLGLRGNVAECGITFDTSWTQFYQGVTGGGRNQEWEYGGRLDYLLNINGEKAGLWKGLFITMHGETRYGQDASGHDGALLPTNISMAFPRPGEDVSALTGLKFTQFLSENFLVYFGKINTLDEYQQSFAAGKGIDRFMNTAFVFNPIGGRTIPYSTLGGGFAILNELEPVFIFSIFNPDDTATTIAVDDLFAKGVVFAAEARLPIKPRGLAGHQVIGGTWSSSDYTAVDRESYVFVPRDGIVAKKKSDSWCAYYAFDQSLWVDPCNPKRGWGIFGNAGVSDGNPNPIQWFLSAGIGGNSPLRSRANDTFGAGYFYVGLSDDFKGLFSGPLLGRVLAQRDEQGVELFYNIAVTPWCHVTTDLQIVEPSTRRFDTTVIAGLRVKLDF